MVSPPKATEFGCIVAANDTLPVPSKLIGEAIISPVISNVLAFCKAVAIPALEA